MGGAALPFWAAGTLRGRWKIQTLSLRSIAIDDTVPMTQLLGNFGHSASTWNTGIIPGRAGACARPLSPKALQVVRVIATSKRGNRSFRIVLFSGVMLAGKISTKTDPCWL